jgi:hypothetical protein
MADAYIRLDLAAQDRLAGAVENLNARLRSDPPEVGESRTGGERITFVSGLVVLFHVDPAARRVTVDDAWPSRRPPGDPGR